MHDFGGNAVAMVVDEVNAGGGLHGRPVELVTRIVQHGAPGTHANVAAARAAWNELVHDEGVLAIIGPSTTPVAIAVHEEVERVGVPCIHWAGTDRACGQWHFQFQAGSLPDEGPGLAFLVAQHGRSRVACFRGEGDYGKAYLDPFIQAAEPLGIEVVAELVAPLTGGDMSALASAARSSGADAVVAMGLFGQGVALARAIRELGSEVACYGNIGFALIGGHSADARNVLQGWYATDQLDPANRVAAQFFGRYERAFGMRPTTASTCFARDLATLMIEGARRAPELSRAGVRQGLESIDRVPSATGGAGTRMGFGPNDRLALKGPRIFVFSRIGEQGVQLYPG